ncbi:hypothetical protein D910_08422 [Dendroctonus ponderosae]|uniref:Uncharacterized protein n=1 Tax=Dendroctonus ponderosae TaxID=77166 RepID=U4UM48_DENPD|nr:hypothetical protein D910_08422 [Dendroctonus ponderosae]KAH1006913.1 hypothetical protein HUJ05_007600 [Dendroctonus ponderosae]
MATKTVTREFYIYRIEYRIKGQGLNEEQKRAVKAEDTLVTIDLWQRTWQGDGETGEPRTASWTRRLIPHLEPWLNRRWGDITYALCQCLTGHGCLSAYLHRFKRIEDPKCLYEDALKDTAEHTLFHCLRFEQITMETEVRVGERLTAENIVLIMMTTKDNWKAIADMMEQIVKIKEGEKRRMQTLE